MGEPCGECDGRTCVRTYIIKFLRRPLYISRHGKWKLAFALYYISFINFVHFWVVCTNRHRFKMDEKNVIGDDGGA